MTTTDDLFAWMRRHRVRERCYRCDAWPEEVWRDHLERPVCNFCLEAASMLARYGRRRSAGL